MSASFPHYPEIPVRFIDQEKSLAQLGSHLQTIPEFAFDTEFDRFRHAYGFSLFLLQIFDGTTCFLVDPLRLTSLQPLFPAFENPEICKVLYSGKEDIDLLKRQGCATRRIFDVQIASRICNHEAVSFGKLVAQECGIELDKSEQTSNWKQRPLTPAQQEYAANDVIPLLALKSKFEAEVERLGMSYILHEENALCEQVITGDFVPRLSPRQQSTYSAHHSEILLEMIRIRDKRAQELNLPPFKIVSDEILEDILKDPQPFLNAPFSRGFSQRAIASRSFCDRLLQAARSIRTDLDWAGVRIRRSEEEVEEIRQERVAYEKRFKPIKEQVVKTYGKVAGEFYMVGVRDVLSRSRVDFSLLKNYQRKMVEEAAQALGIRIPV